MTSFGSIVSTEEKSTFRRQLATPINFGKYKGKPTTLLDTPLQYIKWLYENPTYLEYLVPEIKIFIIHKLDPLLSKDRLEKEEFSMMIPSCKCGVDGILKFSKKNNRCFFTCSKQVLNKFNGKYEGGCDFFKWSFPICSKPDDGCVTFI